MKTKTKGKSKKPAELLFDLNSVLSVESALPKVQRGAKSKLDAELKRLVTEMRMKRRKLSVARIFKTLSQFKAFPFTSYQGFLYAWNKRNSKPKGPMFYTLPPDLVRALKNDSDLF